MASTLFKDLFTPEFINKFGNDLNKIDSKFNNKVFNKIIFSKNWDNQELKQRSKTIANAIFEANHNGFLRGLNNLSLWVENALNSNQKSGIEYLFIPDFIECFGLNYEKESIEKIPLITSFISCEFCIRPFIINNPKKLIKQMYKWSEHDNLHVRRLSTEGIRPRLPWAMQLPELIKNPEPIFPILDNLKSDSEFYVRKSVANNLNDISKDHPAKVLEWSKNNFNINENTNAIIKHALRTLLKSANSEAINIFGYSDIKNFELSQLKLISSMVKMNDELVFSFKLKNKSKTNQIARIEYGISFLKQNNSHSRKVFKISERNLSAGEEIEIIKKHRIYPITTRVYYPGLHKVDLQINGSIFSIGNFTLEL